MKKVIAVKSLDNFKVWVRFNDGVEGVADFSDLAGQGVFTLWNEYSNFEKVRAGSSGELVWSEHVDVCPDMTYMRVTGLTPEQMFPALKRAAAYA